MKFFLVCLVGAVVWMASGCVHSRVLTASSSPDTLAQIMRDFAAHSGQVKLNSGEYVRGKKFTFGPDSLSFMTREVKPRTIPNSDIERVIVHDRRRGLVEGLEWGAGIGAFVGAGFGILASIVSESSTHCSDCVHDQDVLSLPEGVLLGVLAGAIPGAGVGMLIGGTGEGGTILEVRYLFPVRKSQR